MQVCYKFSFDEINRQTIKSVLVRPKLNKRESGECTVCLRLITFDYSLLQVTKFNDEIELFLF